MLIDDLPLSVKRPRPLTAHFTAPLENGYFVFAEKPNGVYTPMQTSAMNVEDEGNNWLAVADISQSAALFIKSMTLSASCDSILLSNAIDGSFNEMGISVSFSTLLGKMQLTQQPISCFDFVRDLEINSALTAIALNTSGDKTNRKEKVICRINGRVRQLPQFIELGYDSLSINITLVAYDILSREWIDLQWGQSKEYVDKLLLNGNRDYQFQRNI